jgi:class 3 adenylate cyclase
MPAGFTSQSQRAYPYTCCLECARAPHSLTQLSQQAELQRRCPGYEISMGYGLHCGWAIEGAIGSDLKIDASYLSPNVNLASRLEAASKQYHVPLLFSREVCAEPRARARVHGERIALLAWVKRARRR